VYYVVVGGNGVLLVYKMLQLSQKNDAVAVVFNPQQVEQCSWIELSKCGTI